MSLDALRGFDMLWIVGAAGIVRALDKMQANDFTNFLSTQLKHVDWEGFHFYDLIFPLFLYIVGVSLVFSLDKALSKGSRAQVLGRVIRRSLLLFALGVFYMGGLSKPWPEVALGGVLHRIAACYFFAALCYIFVRGAAGLATISIALLVGYWGLVTFVPVPDIKLDKSVVERIAAEVGDTSPRHLAASVQSRVRGSYEEGRNLTNYLDFLYLPGKKAQNYYINEGLLSTIPAIALSLFGILTGLLFKDDTVDPRQKIRWLIVGGIAGVVLGLVWSLQFPLIKRIWTSSFILLTGGLCAFLMATFYWMVDVKRWRWWCQPLVWVGCNPLTIYLITPLVSFETISTRLIGGDIQLFLDQITPGLGGLGIAVMSLVLAILLMRLLYVHKIFLRV
jgi:predicted acyltransferase